MRNIKLAIRSLLNNKKDSTIKILSLATGFAVGLVLLAKVNFELTYDNYYPDSDRIYSVGSSFTSLDKPEDEGLLRPLTSGGVAPGMKKEIPEVEEYTRFMYIAGDATFYNKDKNKYKGTFILGDSTLFDLLPRKMTLGNAKDVLSKPMYALVSKSIAEKMGGNVIGEIIELDNYPNKTLTIGGVFEDLPANTSFSYNVIISLASIESFTWDGRDNWIGNDRYFSYVKLKEHVNLENLPKQIRQMQVKYQDIENFKHKMGTDTEYNLTPIKKLHSENEEVQAQIKILSFLAIALIFIAIMNYMLFVITSVVDRAKSIAVHKCYGAENKSISKMILVETLLHFVIALAIASIVIIASKSIVHDLLGVDIVDLFNIQACILIMGVLVGVFLISTLAPMYMYSRLPIASIFRTFNKNRKGWKLALLFIQFSAATFLLVLVVVISSQYKFMLNSDLGYEHENIIYSRTQGLSNSEVETIENRLKGLTEVTSVSRASTLPLFSPSGNMVFLVGQEESLFNAADFEFVGADYLSTMGIEIVEGKGFSHTSVRGEMVIDQLFAQRLEIAGMDGGVIGKSLKVTGGPNGGYEDPSTIVGVYKNIQQSSIRHTDTRPSMMFYAQDVGYSLVVKLNEINGDNIRKIQLVFDEVVPNKDIAINVYSDNLIKTYSNESKLRDTIMIGGIITLIIALIGLIGYVNNEILRRSAEIAVRKINGATLANILKLFAKDILWIAIPAVIIGAVGAYLASDKWLEDFSRKIELNPLLFFVSVVSVLIVIQVVVLLNCLKIANQNPVESLKSE